MVKRPIGLFLSDVELGYPSDVSFLEYFITGFSDAGNIGYVVFSHLPFYKIDSFIL